MSIYDRLASGTCDVCDHPANRHALAAQWHCRGCGGPCRVPADEERPAPDASGDGPQVPAA